MSIYDNIRVVQENVADAAVSNGRNPDEVTIIAVSKTHPAEYVKEAFDAGLTHFGENRVQEAASKIPDVQGDLVWHLIGHLQSNKAGRAAGLFDWVDSIDSQKIVDALNRQLLDADKTIDVLIQVNISGEQVKSGVAPSQVSELAHYIDSLDSLRLRGLMTIGAFGASESYRRKEFVLMRRLFDDIRAIYGDNGCVDVLSMGMSDDYAIAVAEGSTMVRVGTSIFGIR